MKFLKRMSVESMILLSDPEHSLNLNLCVFAPPSSRGIVEALWFAPFRGNSG